MDFERHSLWLAQGRQARVTSVAGDACRIDGRNGHCQLSATVRRGDVTDGRGQQVPRQCGPTQGADSPLVPPLSILAALACRWRRISIDSIARLSYKLTAISGFDARLRW